MAAVQMPQPGKNYAPDFNGKEEELLSFFRTFENAAQQATLTEAQKCQQLGRYTKATIQELWEKRAAFSQNNWAEYKKQILGLYPSIDEERKHTIDTISDWAIQARDKEIESLKEYGRFKRRFLRQADWLTDKNKLSEEEKARIFASGMHRRFREQVERQLIAIYPNHNPRDPYSFTQWDKGADYVLARRSAANIDSESEDNDAKYKRMSEKETRRSHEDGKRDRRQELSVKVEPGSDSLREFKELVLKMNEQNQNRERNMDQALTKLTSTLQQVVNKVSVPVATPPYRPATNYTPQNSYGPPNPNLRPPVSGSNSVPLGQRGTYNGCNFCGEDGHYMRNCWTMGEYLKQNKVVRNEAGRLVLSQGGEIPYGGPGVSLKKRVDDHLTQMAAYYSSLASMVASDSQETGSVTLIEAHPIPSNASFENSSYSALAALPYSQDSITELRELLATLEAEKNKTHPMITRADAKVGGIPGRSAPRRLEIVPNENIIKPNGETDPKQTNNKSASKEAQQAVSKTTRKALIEDPILLDEVMDMLMKGNLSSITPEHIYASSEVLCKRLTNFMRKQKVEVHHLIDQGHSESGTELVVGSRSLQLRELEVLLNGTTPARGILDDGSEIVVVRQDLWKELGKVPLLEDEAIKMEGADGSISQTLGLIANLPVEAGGIVFYVQAQVVVTAPFRFLLGRTFSALTCCSRHDLDDGSTVVTLTDPNPPHTKVTLPTLERIKERNTREGFLIESAPAAGQIPNALPSLRLLGDSDIRQYFEVANVWKYKSVDRKVNRLQQHYQSISVWSETE